MFKNIVHETSGQNVARLLTKLLLHEKRTQIYNDNNKRDKKKCLMYIV